MTVDVALVVEDLEQRVELEVPGDLASGEFLPVLFRGDEALANEVVDPDAALRVAVPRLG